jgi:hypothetical protein
MIKIIIRRIRIYPYNWKNRVSIKPLSLVIVKYDANSLDTNEVDDI